MPYDTYRIPIEPTSTTYLDYLAAGGALRWPMYQTYATFRKYRGPAKPGEIIGMASAIISIGTDDGTLPATSVTVFDTTTRPDAARILITNNSGSTFIVQSATIMGKVRKRTEARLHDKFVDYEAIARDGERVFELGNDFIVTQDQVNQLADYHWKYNRTKKHIYTLTMSGFHSYFEPGEWYTLTVGGAGQDEYISSTVECYAARCSMSTDGAVSSVALREVEEDWKHDSNEVARFVASGVHTRQTHRNYVIVAASGYPGYADYYCDGTDDDVEINAGITYLSSGNGGKLYLTEGTFNLTTSITGTDNLFFGGAGPATLISLDSSNDLAAINFVGTATTHLTNVTITDFSVQRVGTASSGINIRAGYVDNVRIEYIQSIAQKKYGIYCDQSTGSISKCEITGIASGMTGSAFCLRIIGTSIITVDSVYIHDCESTTGQIFGVDLWSFDVFGERLNGGIMFSNSIINTLETTSSICYGIYTHGPNNQIDNVIVRGVTGTSGYALFATLDSSITKVSNSIFTDSTRGIHNQGDYNQFTANYSSDNGDDNGITNENKHNFNDIGTNTLVG